MDIVVSINKPKDITSQDAVTTVKKILNVKKAGHTGTLDPMATGILLICINRATRLASYFSGLDKEYKALMKLGETTDTQDACGKVIEKSARVEVDEASIKHALKSFEGRILQQPPMFSALKHDGKALYTYARKGIEVERKSREVFIHHIGLLDISLPYVSFDTACSKGTYIRTLCDDIGKKLGTGAHLFALERTAIGQFIIDDSLTFEELESISRGVHIKKGIFSMDEALSWLPELKIKDSFIRPVLNGSPIKVNNSLILSHDARIAPGIRIKSSADDLLALGSYSAEKNIIKLDVVFN